MLPQQDVWPREARKDAVAQHGLGTSGGLLARLEDQEQPAVPPVAEAGEYVGVVIAALAFTGSSQANGSPRWMTVAGAIIALLFLLFTATCLAPWRDARTSARAPSKT